MCVCVRERDKAIVPAIKQGFRSCISVIIKSMTDGAGWSGLRGGNAFLPRHWERVSLFLVSGVRPALGPHPPPFHTTQTLFPHVESRLWGGNGGLGR